MGFNDSEIILDLRGIRFGKFLKSLLGFQPIAGLEIGPPQLQINTGRAVDRLGELPEQRDGGRQLLGFELGQREVVLDGVVGGIRGGAQLQGFGKGGYGSSGVAVLKPTNTQKIPSLPRWNSIFQCLLEATGCPPKVFILEIGHAGLKVF